MSISAWEQPVEPSGEPPGCVTEDGHGGGYEDEPYDGCVEEDGCGESEPHHLGGWVLAEDEPEKDRDHDEGGGRDDPCGARDSANHRADVVLAQPVLLLDAGQQEHLVVHREPEQDR